VNENCLLQVTTAVLRTRIFGRNPWHEADLKIENPHVSDLRAIGRSSTTCFLYSVKFIVYIVAHMSYEVCRMLYII